MRYMLLVVGNADLVAAAKAEDLRALMGAFMAYTRAMQEAGVYVAGDPLKPPHTATTVRMKDGKAQVLDGPYAESREQLGGWFLIEAPDKGAALDWAARCPGVRYGAVEVREIELIPGHNDQAG